MMWWPILNPLPVAGDLPELRKMGYVAMNAILLTPACALVIFANEPLYLTYTDPQVWAVALGYCIPKGADFILENFSGPQAFYILPPLEDQQLGGVIMKVVQEIIDIIILAYIFFKWYAKEKKDDLIEMEGMGMDRTVG